MGHYFHYEMLDMLCFCKIVRCKTILHLKSGDSEQVKGQKTELSTDFYSKLFY